MISRTKDPVKVRAGTIGARNRWGPARIVRLDALSPEQRCLVLALIDAVGNEKAGPVIETIGTGEEARRASDEPSAA